MVNFAVIDVTGKTSETFQVQKRTYLKVKINELETVKIFRGLYGAIHEFKKRYQTISRSRVSSGSIVSDYGLDDWAIGVRSPARAKDFSSNLCVQTGSETHPASCPMGTGGKSATGA
jgi:hypothetical protein